MQREAMMTRALRLTARILWVMPALVLLLLMSFLLWFLGISWDDLDNDQ